MTVSWCRRISISGRTVSSGVLDDFAQLDRLVVQRELAARDARDVEQVVDQARQVAVLAREHVARPHELRVVDRLALHELDRALDRSERIPQLVREHGEEIVLAPVRGFERFLRAHALGDLRLQRAVRLRELGVRLRERRVQRFELARFFRLQRGVGIREVLVRFGETPIEPLELAPLAVELDQHLDFAAQDLGHDGHVDVIDRARAGSL